MLRETKERKAKKGNNFFMIQEQKLINKVLRLSKKYGGFSNYSLYLWDDELEEWYNYCPYPQSYLFRCIREEIFELKLRYIIYGETTLGERFFLATNRVKELKEAQNDRGVAMGVVNLRQNVKGKGNKKKRHPSPSGEPPEAKMPVDRPSFLSWST